MVSPRKRKAAPAGQERRSAGFPWKSALFSLTGQYGVCLAAFLLPHSQLSHLRDADLHVGGRVTKRLQDQLGDALCAGRALVGLQPQTGHADGNLA